jgi:hypothetical protein
MRKSFFRGGPQLPRAQLNKCPSPRLLQRFIKSAAGERASDLRVSLSGGSLLLTNPELNLDALVGRLPLRVERAYARQVRVTVPWTALATQPIQARGSAWTRSEPSTVPSHPRASLVSPLCNLLRLMHGPAAPYSANQGRRRAGRCMLKQPNAAPWRLEPQGGVRSWPGSARMQVVLDTVEVVLAPHAEPAGDQASDDRREAVSQAAPDPSGAHASPTHQLQTPCIVYMERECPQTRSRRMHASPALQ